MNYGKQESQRSPQRSSGGLLRRVLSGDATSADLNVARGFLKDNGSDAGLDQSEPLADLAKTLPFNVDMKKVADG